MYQDFFRLSESPFAIVPNPKFYFLSERHKEALSHVLSGIEDGGGLALLTGEVGTGKTTTMKALLERMPEQSQVATILNPSVSVLELMQTLCDELGIAYAREDGFKHLNDAISAKLHDNDKQGIQTILLVDEAQHLMPDVLEQLRLLTNIETSQRKLLKVILIGQPELQEMLRQQHLRQLAQRITARYHLMPLTAQEVRQYILHRLSCADRLDPLFDEGAYKVIARESGGIPRLINLVCDQSLKMAHRDSKQRITAKIATKASKEVLHWQSVSSHAERHGFMRYWPVYLGAIGGAALLAVAIRWGLDGNTSPAPTVANINTAPQVQTERAPVPTVKAATAPIVVDVAIKKSPAREASTSNIAPANTSAPQSLASLPATVETVAFADLAKQSLSAGSAMQALYRLWGFEADVLAAGCSSDVRGELACYKATLPLTQLLSIDRPAVLTMNGPVGQRWFAVLYGMGEGQFELLAGDQRVMVSEAFFKQAWTGDALLLWRPPQANTSTLSIGQRSERVRWLDQRLNLVLGETGVPSDRFGPNLRAKVRDFQRSKGLDADGYAGPITLMVLDTVLTMPGPALTNSIEATQSESTALAQGDIVVLSTTSESALALTPLPAPKPVVVATTQPAPKPASQAPENASTSAQKSVTEANTEVTTITASGNGASNPDGDLNLEDLDLSSLSPELALKVQNALGGDRTRGLDAKLERTDGASNVVSIADISSQMFDRLPKMDFQTHIYASDESRSWVKVNGREAKEGQFVADGVLLRGIEPQQVVVQFEDALIAIPALTSW
ncbi:AAA family ATPase [Enterovibrio baiacu]|uniref:AAA family ATPase n=1 Tax=Enterovibrio baiacu TaxID=2491023 RepID=UPI001010C862|nr:AAA family ATPase [Enterovibrio baiacu]MBE1276320.1 AAA family ATPase [Enterovibrio baiacu]